MNIVYITKIWSGSVCFHHYISIFHPYICGHTRQSRGYSTLGLPCTLGPWCAISTWSEIFCTLHTLVLPGCQIPAWNEMHHIVRCILFYLHFCERILCRICIMLFEHLHKRERERERERQRRERVGSTQRKPRG